VELWWSAVVELGSSWSREGEVRGRRSPGRRGWGTPANVTVTFCSRGGSKFWTGGGSDELGLERTAAMGLERREFCERAAFWAWAVLLLGRIGL